MNSFYRGLRSGVPIALGYLAVSFSFGIIAVSLGLDAPSAVLISALTLTSAGQLAAVGVIASAGGYITMLISQLTINMRYAFMSVSLTQRLSPRFRGVLRWLLGFYITDEIFAVASREEEITPSFFFGLSLLPHIGWTLGTLVGALVGGILPEAVLSSLSLALYAMFVAIVLPAMRAERSVLAVVLVAIALSSLFYFLPPLTAVPSGLAVSISALLAAFFGAVFFPRTEGEVEK